MSRPYLGQRPQQNDEAIERDMLTKLATLARGFDPVTLNPVSSEEMMAAQRQYHELKTQSDQQKLARERLAQEAELEHRRIDVEVERVQVQKAEVMVRALEVAAHAGVSPEQLLGAIRDFGAQLLPGPSNSPLLEKKGD